MHAAAVWTREPTPRAMAVFEQMAPDKPGFSAPSDTIHHAEAARSRLQSAEPLIRGGHAHQATINKRVARFPDPSR